MQMKFARRFGYVEQQVKASGKPFSDFTLEQLDAFWNEAKQLERSKIMRLDKF